jgi:uncharacterized protein YraI
MVRVLNVRSGPSTASPRFRALLYGSVVYPVGRESSGDWIMIDLGTNTGWVWRDAVFWDPAIDLNALQVIQIPRTTPQPATPTSSPAPTGTPAAATATASPSLPPSATPTVTPTRQPTLTPEPSPTATPAPAAAAATPEPTQPPVEAAPTPLPAVSPEQDNSRGIIGWLAPGGALLLAGVLYGWRWASGRREVQRYSAGFPLEICPTCQIGHLQLEEHVWHLLGIPVVRRAVQCDTCRSVLRQTRPGLWRYTIDPFANPYLAEEHNGCTLTDGGLPEFAERARAYEPAARPDAETLVSEEFERVVEHLEALEAQALAEDENVSPDKEEEGLPQPGSGEEEQGRLP